MVLRKENNFSGFMRDGLLCSMVLMPLSDLALWLEPELGSLFA